MATEKAKEFGVDQLRVSPIVLLSANPPWLFPDTNVDLTLLGKNNNRSTQQYIDSYHGYVQIGTDASRSLANRMGVAFIISEFNLKVVKRVNEGISVYTGEMVAIVLALHWVEEVEPLRIVICSDSSSLVTL